MSDKTVVNIQSIKDTRQGKKTPISVVNDVLKEIDQGKISQVVIVTLDHNDAITVEWSCSTPESVAYLEYAKSSILNG